MGRNNKIWLQKREERLNMLYNFRSMRIGHDQILWSMFSGFWATNALFLVSLFAFSKQWKLYSVLLIISVVGFLTSLIWYQIHARTLSRIEMYEESIEYIEIEKLHLSKKLLSSKPPKKTTVDVKARVVMNISIFLVLFAWFVVLIVSVINKFA